MALHFLLLQERKETESSRFAISHALAETHKNENEHRDDDVHSYADRVAWGLTVSVILVAIFPFPTRRRRLQR